MDRDNPYEVAKAIVALDVWDRVKHQWAVVPRGAEAPFICAVERAAKPASSGKYIKAKLLMFSGFDTFRDFAIAQRFPEYGVGRSQLDFMHTALLVGSDGGFEIFSYMPGFIPHLVDDERERQTLAHVLYECYGLMMRIEEDPELLMKHASERALFARRQDGGGAWRDGKFTLPPDPGLARSERVALRNADLAKAKKLPVEKDVEWEADFIPMPEWRTNEKRPRILYIFAVMDSQGGGRILWNMMSVGDVPADENDPHAILSGPGAGLQRLWESLAQRLLTVMVREGRVPGTIRVRNGRMMRFLRPLSMQLPFRMVQHSGLPAVDAALDQVRKTGRL